MGIQVINQIKNALDKKIVSKGMPEIYSWSRVPSSSSFSNNFSIEKITVNKIKNQIIPIKNFLIIICSPSNIKGKINIENKKNNNEIIFSFFFLNEIFISVIIKL